MFHPLRKKWKVSGIRLLLILVTFALGGSLTGYLARRILLLLTINNVLLYVLLYIIMITLLWPLSVLVISLFTGQFPFFRRYLERMAVRMGLVRSGSSEETIKQKMENINDKAGQKQIVIFASGAGSNAQRIIDHFRGSPRVRVSMIVSNKPGAGVTKIAAKENIPVLIIEKERFFQGDAYLPELKAAGCDLVVLAGFLWKIPQPLISAFPRAMINIHPALLPKYGGRGMYGQYVHEAVLQAGEMESGITIHYVDEHYDNGDVIFQAGCPVLDNDGPEALAQRIHELEHLHYPRVIEELLTGNRYTS